MESKTKLLCTIMCQYIKLSSLSLECKDVGSRTLGGEIYAIVFPRRKGELVKLVRSADSKKKKKASSS